MSVQIKYLGCVGYHRSAMSSMYYTTSDLVKSPHAAKISALSLQNYENTLFTKRKIRCRQSFRFETRGEYTEEVPVNTFIKTTDINALRLEASSVCHIAHVSNVVRIEELYHYVVGKIRYLRSQNSVKSVTELRWAYLTLRNIHTVTQAFHWISNISHQGDSNRVKETRTTPPSCRDTMLQWTQSGKAELTKKDGRIGSVWVAWGVRSRESDFAGMHPQSGHPRGGMGVKVTTSPGPQGVLESGGGHLAQGVLVIVFVNGGGHGAQGYGRQVSVGFEGGTSHVYVSVWGAHPQKTHSPGVCGGQVTDDPGGHGGQGKGVQVVVGLGGVAVNANDNGGAVRFSPMSKPFLPLSEVSTCSTWFSPVDPSTRRKRCSSIIANPKCSPGVRNIVITAKRRLSDDSMRPIANSEALDSYMCSD
ncbi:hypothetical protein FA15DRAFT_740787 [Coprinopsis marcescibilis]|uniref:Uncharacterized protein n=1 Tax=Coprinopsis marcescibilis TaxID=230819 RepID=A0A5C3L8R5_COPMA|nr:hypothetical protein FA15DRAFT_740787 [Coprinopsis marcescibilis]